MATSPSLSSDEATKLVAANTKFALKLLQQLTTETPDNIFMSPVSISVAMAMTYLGARGDSAVELADGMGFSDVAAESLHESFAELREMFHKTGGKYELRTASKLYGDKSYGFLEEFIRATEKHYAAPLTAVDFVTNHEEVRKIINSWVEDQTANKIQDLLPQGVLNSLTRLVLVNAIYFKGDWDKKFDPKHTKKSDFFVSDSEKVQVDMMYKKASFRLGMSEDLQCEVLELPYVDSHLSMFVFLPHKAMGVQGLIEKLTPQNLINVEQDFRLFPGDTHVYLPRFKLEQSFSLKSTLAALGIQQIFSENADFSGIDGTRELFVSEILHKAFVVVNEEGSEAAAATVVVMELNSIPMWKEFKADRPFVFMIRDNRTSSVLFLGKLLRPEASADNKFSKDEKQKDARDTRDGKLKKTKRNCELL